jgi:putative transposase
MARPLRIEYPDAFYHITSRGNERKNIFRIEKDCERFLGYLESATDRYGARIHCFCLMSNHYHLLLGTPRGNLHAILHHLNTSYTNYFNARTGRVGHLFQGRYRAILVEKDSYAVELSRYIHLNPVRANLVRDPLRYPWSSYGAYVEKQTRWNWLRRGFILGQICNREGEAERKYQRFVEEGMGKGVENPLKNMVASTVLGSEGFVDWVKQRWIKKVFSHREVPALGELSLRPDLSSLWEEVERELGEKTGQTRKVALYLSHQLSGLPLCEIGKFFGGIGPSAVTQNTRRVLALLERDHELKRAVRRLKSRLSE